MSRWMRGFAQQVIRNSYKSEDLMEANYERHLHKPISDYDGLILVSHVKSVKSHAGNTIVVDTENRIYNCHPQTSNYGESGYPIRWQITSEWDTSCPKTLLKEFGFEAQQA